MLREIHSTEHGLRCLFQAIVDGRGGRVPRQVRADGSVVSTATGAEPEQTDRWLRETFPKADVSDDSSSGAGPEAGGEEVAPMDVHRERIYGLRDEASTVARRVAGLLEVVEDGHPLVERVGIPSDVVAEISSDLDRARTRVSILGDIWQRTSDISAG